MEKFLKILEWVEAPPLVDHGVVAAELLDVYQRVKASPAGSNGVEHSAWIKGVKVVGALTPFDVASFQQFWLSPDEESRAHVFGDTAAPKGGRKRCALDWSFPNQPKWLHECLTTACAVVCSRRRKEGDSSSASVVRTRS